MAPEIEGGPAPRKHRRGRTPKPLTPQSLERAALFHINRYAPPRAGLVRVLRRRAERARRVHGGDAEADEAMIQALAEKLVAQGLVNDRAFAETRARFLFERGMPLKAIAYRLAEKGLAAPDVEAALAALTDHRDAETCDLEAARRYAQKRRLGLYRHGPAGPEDERRDLAKMARRGFGYGIARRALMEDPFSADG